MLSICIEKNKVEKKRPHLSCDFHKLGAHLYSKLLVAFVQKSRAPEGRMGGRKEGWIVKPG